MKLKLNGQMVKGFIKTTGKFVEHHAPAIAASIAIACTIGAVYKAIKAGPEVQKALEEAEIKKNEQALKERMEDGNDDTPIEELTRKERLKIKAKYYWPSILLAVLSSACMIGSVYFGNRKIKALTLLCAAAETSMTTIESTAREVIGDKKVDAIKDKILDKKLGDNPPTEENIVNTGNGNLLCYEPWFGLYFRSSIEACNTAYTELCKLATETEEVHMNDFHFLLGIPQEASLAKEVGWFTDPDSGKFEFPKYKSETKTIKYNGVEEPLYIAKLSRPKSWAELEGEKRAYFR